MMSATSYHYRVCRVMIRRDPSVVEKPEDCVYVVKPLKLICCHAMIQNKQEIPEGDLKDLEAELKIIENDPSPFFSMKSRDCPEVGRLKIGEFQVFPKFRTEIVDAFGIDLVNTGNGFFFFSLQNLVLLRHSKHAL